MPEDKKPTVSPAALAGPTDAVVAAQARLAEAVVAANAPRVEAQRKALEAIDKAAIKPDTSPQAGQLPADHKAWRVVYPNGSTGVMTQQQWDTRDPALGIKRVDESGKPLVELENVVWGE